MKQTPNTELFIACALDRIASALETIVDRKKRTLRMVDVDRANVYKTHLGKNLRNRKSKIGDRK